jgi:GNAT superfamily N-acetyltransferase
MDEIAPPLHGKPAHERTLKEFVGANPSIDRLYGLWREEAFYLFRLPFFGEYSIKAENIFRTKPSMYGTSDPNVTGRLYHRCHVGVLSKDPAYALLVVDTMDADTGRVWIEKGVVGEFYRDDFGLNILGISEAYRGKGIAPHFVAAAIEATGNVEPSGAYSPAGLATRKKAHRILVENAIKRGDSVPTQVLEEYA